MGASIIVEFKNGMISHVDAETLDSYLKNNEIAKFKRSDGWVVVDRDRLRNLSKGVTYSIPERRISH